MDMYSEYRKKLLEMQIKINNKERVILEQRNIVLEKQLMIEHLYEEIKKLKKIYVEPQQEFLNKNIKTKHEEEKEKKECIECMNATTMSFKCDNEYCCNFL